MTLRTVLLLVVFGALDLGPAHAQEQAEHLPGRAVSAMDVHSGLEVTLFASEPMIVNPTNMDVDAHGRVWVVEGHNYRLELNPTNPVRPEGDRIVILEDLDGDGRADTSKVYYQGRDIDAALGIAVLGDRVIVSAYENVFVFTDEDGDDRPDRKELLFTGMSDESHDHSVHAFSFGPDGKLYFNVGNESGQIRDRLGNLVIDRAGNAVTSRGRPYRQGMVFRVDEDGSDFEVLGHNFRNPYEVAVDSYGTLWQSDNDDDGNRAVRINYVMEFGNYGFTDEMTGAGWRTPRTGMHEEIPLRHWHLRDPGVVPNVLQTGAGSPTGLAIYEGRLLPEVFHDGMIHTDAGPNVVRAYPVEKEGAGYRAEIVPIIEGARDPWFRPSDVTVAPDGSIFVADWYDPGVGGHQAGDLKRGRIFRVAPEGTPYRTPAFGLSTPEEAVETLQSPNMARRYLAWKKLHAWGETAEPALRTMWASDNPRFRARALWLLGRIDGRGAHYVEQALASENPDLRITGLRLARQLDVDVIPYVRRLVDDPSPQVRREAALALRHHPSPEAAELWADLAAQYDGRDRWYLEALGIAADRQWDRFFDAWQARVGDAWDTPAGRDLVWRARARAALPLLADLAMDGDVALEQRLRYFRAFDFHPQEAKVDVLRAMVRRPAAQHPDVRRLIVARLDDEGLERAPELEPVVRATLDEMVGTEAFVNLLGRYRLEGYDDVLLEMALGHEDGDVAGDAARLLVQMGEMDALVRAAEAPATAEQAVAALGRVGNDRAVAYLEQVIRDEARSLAVRRAAVEAYGSGWWGEPRLLEMAQQGELPEALEPAAARVLMRAWRTSIRDAAAQVLPVPVAADARPLPPVRDLAQRQGDGVKGRVVFERACASCHQVDGRGTDFGPALSEIGSKLPKEALYESILHPSAGVSFGYEGYLVETTGGAQYVGYVSSETETHLTLRQMGGTSQRLAKREIAKRTKLDRSLMPEGLHQTMSEEELVDLVEYLADLKQERAERGGN